MSGPDNETPTGDSTPDLEFLREHDDGSRTHWPTDPDHDSATDMLPPEEGAAESSPVAAADEIDGNESSIHHSVTDEEDPPLPDATAVLEPATSDEPEVRDGDSAIQGVVETMSQIAHAIEGEPAADANAVVRTEPTERAAPRKHSLLMVALASYASAVTIVLLYLLFERATAPSRLESLPDVPPLEDREVQLVPVDAEMPAGHTLALGQSQRFGNIVITPLRVVREPLEFAHFSNRDDQTRPDTEPVLKLWVRFTNVSSDQLIAPLDGQLLFTRDYREETGRTRANQFVCPLDAKRSSDEPVLVYDHPPSSEFDLADQQLGRALEPGESYETYVPTSEGSLDDLKGELVWRVHFRKGYSPSGYGVTTVVEVRFDSLDIQSTSES